MAQRSFCYHHVCEGIDFILIRRGTFIMRFMPMQTDNNESCEICKLVLWCNLQWASLACSAHHFMIDFLLSTNAVLPARFYGSEQEYRLYNITATAFFQLSLFYLMLLHFLLAYNAKHNTLPSILVFFMLCIGLISGRTFLLLSVVSIFSVFQMALCSITHCICYFGLVYWRISYQKILMLHML